MVCSVQGIDSAGCISTLYFHLRTTSSWLTSCKINSMRAHNSCFECTRMAAQQSLCRLAKERLHQVEPRSMLGSEHEVKAIGPGNANPIWPRYSAQSGDDWCAAGSRSPIPSLPGKSTAESGRAAPWRRLWFWIGPDRMRLGKKQFGAAADKRASPHTIHRWDTHELTPQPVVLQLY